MTSPEPTKPTCQCDAELRRRLDNWRANQADITAAVREALSIADDPWVLPPEALVSLPTFIRNLTRERDDLRAALVELKPETTTVHAYLDGKAIVEAIRRYEARGGSA